MNTSRALASNSGLLQVGKRSPSRLSCTKFLDIHKVDSRDEALGFPRLGNLGVELVDLLKRQTLGFIDAEMHEYDTDDAESSPDEEHLRLEIAAQALAPCTLNCSR